MNFRAVAIGWVFLTLGVLIGGFWATQVHAAPDPRVQAMSVADPKILIAIISWAVYSFALFARKRMGWSGRRAAWRGCEAVCCGRGTFRATFPSL